MTPDDVRAAAEQVLEFHERFAPLFGKEQAQDHAYMICDLVSGRIADGDLLWGGPTRRCRSESIGKAPAGEEHRIGVGIREGEQVGIRVRPAVPPGIRIGSPPSPSPSIPAPIAPAVAGSVSESVSVSVSMVGAASPVRPTASRASPSWSGRQGLGAPHREQAADRQGGGQCHRPQAFDRVHRLPAFSSQVVRLAGLDGDSCSSRLSVIAVAEPTGRGTAILG